jgi:glycine cleavage system H lipoate-binding protein/ABC-type phosphate transport system substrate-binding protein
MKKLAYIIAGLLLTIVMNSVTGAPVGSTADPNDQSSLMVTSTPELLPLVTEWANAFNEVSAESKVAVSETKSPAAGLEGKINIMAAADFLSLNQPQAWKMAVGCDAVVPVISKSNPLFQEISAKGFTAEALVRLLTTREQNWGIIKDGVSNPVNIMISDNPSVISQLAEFCKLDESELLSATRAASTLVEAVGLDVYSIGFCRLTDIMGTEANTFAPAIAILPVDKNRNGRIDNFENVYGSPDAFMRGVWTGKYPTVLTGNIYAVAAEQPQDEKALAFLAWINEDGQRMLNTMGFSDLPGIEREANLMALATPEEFTGEMEAPVKSAGWIKLLLSLAALGLIITVVAVVMSSRDEIKTEQSFKMSPALSPESIHSPAGLYFDKTHTWAFMEKDGLVKIGLDDFMQHLTGPLTRIRMKEAGEKVRKGEKIMTLVREGKQLDLYAPLSGIIRQQNTALLGDITKVNTSPYGEGWVYVIEPVNWTREIQFMFMGIEYRQWLSEEFGRLRDFFASSVQNNTVVFQHVVLQDGGEIEDNILAGMGPEVWEDFQTKFIDTSR